MIIKIGDMFESSDILLFTANNVVNRGRLIMGAGAAVDVANAYPAVPVLLGTKISRYMTNGFYGIVTSQQHDRVVGAFQTKYHYKNPSTIELVKRSIEQLVTLANNFPNKLIHLNFPGIGLGGLKEKDVLPLLGVLPDNVIIWRKK